MINLRQNKGFALTFSLIFLFLIVSFMAVYILAVANGVSQANRTANLKKAYYAADAGLVDAYERITISGSTIITSSTCSNSNIPSTCSAPYISSTTTGTDNGKYAVGPYSASSVNGSYIVSVAYSSSPRANYTITSEGTYANQKKILQLKIIGKTIASYAYWSNTEINPTLGTLWWITGQTITGPVQTNGTLNIMGDPIFYGQVSEVGSSPNYYTGISSTPSTIFPDGITNNAPSVSVAPTSTLSNLKTVATSSGLVLTGTSTVIFNAAGTISVTGQSIVNGKTTTYNNTSLSIPSSGEVIYVQSTSGKTDGNVTVQGTVNGQVTVAADQNIYISGNILYQVEPPSSWNPNGNANSPDVLGLVANTNITVVEADAPAQLEIDGVLMALQGSFNVDQYSKNPDPVSSGGGDGANVDMLGSLINNFSGATGTTNSKGQLVSGWNEIQDYDNRLSTLAPPGFPILVNSNNVASYAKYMNPQGITECNVTTGVCG